MKFSTCGFKNESLKCRKNFRTSLDLIFLAMSSYDWTKKGLEWTVDMAERMLKYLECPVCLEAAERGQVFTCKNGHFMCGGCIKGIQSNNRNGYYWGGTKPAARCPMCRDEHVERNQLAEELKKKAYKILQAKRKVEPPKELVDLLSPPKDPNADGGGSNPQSGESANSGSQATASSGSGSP